LYQNDLENKNFKVSSKSYYCHDPDHSSKISN